MPGSQNISGGALAGVILVVLGVAIGAAVMAALIIMIYCKRHQYSTPLGKTTESAEKQRDKAVHRQPEG